MSKHLIRILNLGKRSYEDVMRTQEVLRQRVITQGSAATQPLLRNKDIGIPEDSYPEEPGNFLLLVEHWPVYTAGFRDKFLTEQDENKLKALGAEVCRTNRGGLVTFHGPGQLVAYPILNLKMMGFGLREYVARLESTLVGTCKALGVDGQTTSDTGVWVEDRKIASIGVNAKRHVTMHGIALNCSTDLSWFDHITPCGLEGVEMTSLSKETGKDINVSETERHFLSNFSQTFETTPSSVSDYVPAAITGEDPAPIDARLF